MKTVLFALGTRPEAIKLAPLLLELRAHSGSFRTHLCSTGQQADLVAPMLAVFGVQADTNLEVMRHGQGLASLSARLLEELAPLMENIKPDLVVVQGDTATTLCAAQAAFYQHIPVLHVEAGLRTGDCGSPFPEEMNRRLVTRLARLHCAPTPSAADNLRREGIPGDAIAVTGNTGIDALAWVLERLRLGELHPPVSFPPAGRKRVVATMHRREAFGTPLENLCAALNTLVAEENVELIVPLHPNPEAGARVASLLHPHPHLHLSGPLDYVSFIALLQGADLVLTDSGGIQEEAPYLGVPLVVLRSVTERLEGVKAGVAQLAGFTPQSILKASRAALFSARPEPLACGHHGIYGDGRASVRIRELISSFQDK